jgi:hypothetical protein
MVLIDCDALWRPLLDLSARGYRRARHYFAATENAKSKHSEIARQLLAQEG